MIRTGVILAEKLSETEGFPEWWSNYWFTVEKYGRRYKAIRALPHEFSRKIINQLEAYFDTEEQFRNWLTIPPQE